MKKHIAGLTRITQGITNFYNEEKDGKWLYRNRCYLTVFCVLLVINVICILPMKAPMIIDEYLTFSNSAFLSGRYDWSGTYSAVPQTPYYGYTQGLFYIPFFYLPICVYSVFKCALFINACLMALVPVFALYILNQISENADFSNMTKMICAISIGSYSAYIYNSKGVWNETMLMVCPWLLASILFKLYNKNEQKKEKILWSAVLGSSCIYYYALNSRALIGIIAVVCVALFVRLILKIRMVSFVALGISGGLAYFLHKCIKHYLVASLLLASDQGNIQNSSFSMINALKRIHFETVFMALKGYFGNIYYVFLTSFGLTGIAIAWFLYLSFNAFRKNHKTESANKQLIFTMFSILCLVGTWGMLFVVSYDTFTLKDFTKQDAMMYGRYFDPIIPLTILSAVSIYIAKEKRKSRIIMAGLLISGIVMLVGTVATGGLMVEQNHLSAQPLNMGIPIAFAGKTFGGRTTWPDVWILFRVIVTFSGIIVILLKKKKYIFGFCCLFAFYMYAAVCTLTEYCWPTSKLQYKGYEDYSKFFDQLEARGIEYDKVYFISNGYRDRGINIQYAIPDQKIEQLNYYLEGYKCVETIEENSIIISNYNLFLDTFFDNLYFVKNDNFFVWSYGEELGRQLEAGGYAVSETNPIHIGYEECILTGENLVMDGAVMLGNNGLLCGQYMTLISGEYLVSVEGTFLDGAQFDYYWDKGRCAIDVQNFVKKDSDNVAFIMYVSEVCDDLEVRVSNSGSQPVLIQSIDIQPILQDEKARQFNSVGFCPIRTGRDDYFSRCKFLNPTYETGQNYFYFGKNNGIVLENVDLEEGEYHLEIFGEDLAVELQFKSNEGKNIADIEILERQNIDNGIFFTFENHKEIENAQIIIYTLSSSDFITIPNGGIVKISDISLVKK